MFRVPRMKEDIRSLTYTELSQRLSQMGEKPYRADQIYLWLHKKCVLSADEMTNIPETLRSRLNGLYFTDGPRPVRELVSKTDGTRKYLFALQDGNVIESVFMRYHHGNSVCISSQVGCAMGCAFCASTIGGRIRNLSIAEMLGQVYAITRLTGERVSNVVVMGSGEPLDNYDNLVGFIHMITDERGLNISARNLTVSTCGLVPAMKRLADEKLAITLALSLHATSQEKREKLMPIARRYHLDEVMDAVRYYHEKTGRRVTFEYSLVAGENDSAADAAALASLIRGPGVHVNLIPVNPVRETGFLAPDRAKVQRFAQILEKEGINATVRREMGRDINGACGQLRRGFEETRRIQTDNRAKGLDT